MPNDFKDMCIEDAIAHGYPIEGSDTLHAYFQGGAFMAFTGYAHREPSIRMYVARYTTTVLYLDDHFKTHFDGLLHFNERFMRNDPQEEIIFQCLSRLLEELPQYFNAVACNLITVSTFNFVTSLIIEHDTVDTEVREIIYFYVSKLTFFRFQTRLLATQSIREGFRVSQRALPFSYLRTTALQSLTFKRSRKCMTIWLTQSKFSLHFRLL